MKIILITNKGLIIKVVNYSWFSWAIFYVSRLSWFRNKKFIGIIALMDFMRSRYTFFCFRMLRRIYFWNILWKVTKWLYFNIFCWLVDNINWLKYFSLFFFLYSIETNVKPLYFSIKQLDNCLTIFCWVLSFIVRWRNLFFNSNTPRK